MRYKFYQIVIPLLILCQHNQVIATLVRLPLLLIHGSAGHIHFTAYNRLEQLAFRFCHLGTTIGNLRFLVFTLYLTAFNTGNPFLEVLYLPLWPAVLLVDIVGELLDTEHISMVGHGNAFHTILHGLVNQPADTCLTIQKRVLGMDM